VSKLLRVLLVEDSAADATLLLRELHRHGYEPVCERVVDAAGMEAALDRQAWDVIVSDYHLPQFGAPAALALLKRKGIDVPFLLFTGSLPEAAAAEALRNGADDYVMKHDLSRLIPAIRREVESAVEGRAPLPNETALLPLAALIQSAEDAIIGVNLAGLITLWNPGAERLFGHPAREAVAQSISILVPPEQRDEWPSRLERIQRGERLPRLTAACQHRDGKPVEVSIKLSPIKDPQGRIVGVSLIAHAVEPAVAPKRPPTAPAILLAEDENSLREAAAGFLRSEGFEVLEAGDGAEALAILRSERGRAVELLVTDGRMPKLGGADLAIAFRQLKPGGKVLFITGVPEAIAGANRALIADIPVLSKPFALSTLTAKVREMLPP
jgi:PAS domain S-box-containing protein